MTEAPYIHHLNEGHRPSSRLRSRPRPKSHERHDVSLKESSSGGCRSGRGPSQSQPSDDIDGDREASSLERRNRLLRWAAAVLIALTTWAGLPQSQKSSSATNANDSEETTSITRAIRNTFLPKNIKPRDEVKPQLAQQIQIPSIRKRWNPCSNIKYQLERHDHEPRHGDVCRAKGGTAGLYVCPEGCRETAGDAPYCANDEAGPESKRTKGDRGGPCRVRIPGGPPEYRCDYGSACIMAVGTPREQFKGRGKHRDDTCGGKCGDGRRGELTPWIVHGGRCATDADCSLSGACTPEGRCQCDPWAEGLDCSYLKFAPVDRSRLGYLDERHSSWGGSVVQKSDGMYHMYVSEIVCKEDPDVSKRCGLNGWETHSRIAQAASSNIDGPYRRSDSDPVVLHPEHHNPSVHVSPKTGDWHLYTISGSRGPIERMISGDEGKTWGDPRTMSPRQNPGPLLKEDGSTYLFYRADGLDIPFPTCSDEGISFQHCPSDDEECKPPNDVLIFGHTGEDPSVFRDHRGYYHMLFNALPYKCVPKFEQGGHAWSIDGFNWSEPRVGAFDTTVRFTDGSSMKCERRERPQMVVGKDGRPVAMVSAVTGCPKALGDESSDGDGRYYRGGDDSFTLVQKMGAG